jgi:hypothetical protein
MCVVQSADTHANLSSIEITWYLGKNCMSVGTGHFIGPCVSIRRSLSMIDPHVEAHVCCQSADAGLILSSIEIIWYLGQN